jgi:hypothetical protein
MRDRIALGGGAGFDGPQPLKLRRRPRTSQLHPRAGQPDQRVVVFMIRCRSRWRSRLASPDILPDQSRLARNAR